jgi:secondary thiamine-phosphate synthase enzyme
LTACAEKVRKEIAVEMEARLVTAPGALERSPESLTGRLGRFIQSLNGGVRTATAHFDMQTDPGPAFHDITETVQKHLDHMRIGAGLALIATMHTTAGIVINENERLLWDDFKRFLTRLAPPGCYEHDDMSRRVDVPPDEPVNGHSHCQHLLLTPSVVVPVTGGSLGLGRWQRVLLVELDAGRNRRVTIQVTGQ